MASLNRVQLIGRLGRDPELRFTSDGTAIANLSVATSERYKDKSGEWIDRAEWHKIVMYARLAEIAGEYLVKGSLVYLEGRLQTRKWKDKEGVEKYNTEIVADRLQMLGERATRDEGGGASGQQTTQAPHPDDDIPF